MKMQQLSQSDATNLAHRMRVTGNPTVCLQTKISDVFRYGR